MWDDYPIAAVAGLTWWGANSLGYQFGYSDYHNPYYTEEMPVYYTEPIVNTGVQPIQETTVAPVQETTVAPVQQTTVVNTSTQAVSQESLDEFTRAREAFTAGQYDAALKLINAAAARMPHDAVAHEFRSLVLFALQRYAEAAATIHPVLDVSPGWDWKTLSSLYASTDTYTNQLRALEGARDKNQGAAEIHFLLGYHYLSCGHSEQALSEFRKVLQSRPNDAVAASLVATLSPRDTQQAQAPAAEIPQVVPLDSVVGNWSAKAKGSADYSMALKGDGSFTWGFTNRGRKQEVKGVYTVEDNVLAMEPDSGGVLLAELSVKGPDALHFKMIGGSASDPGLDFQRDSTGKSGEQGKRP